MLSSALRRMVALLALSAGLAACGEDSGTTVIFPTTLRPGTWYLHDANGDTLPALVAERFIGIATELTFLDSATITVIAGGTFEQRHHISVFVSGALDRQELLFDRGDWARQTAGYAFVSDLRSRSFTGTMPFASLLSTTEPILSWASAPSVAGNYRLTPP